LVNIALESPDVTNISKKIPLNAQRLKDASELAKAIYIDENNLLDPTCDFEKCAKYSKADYNYSSLSLLNTIRTYILNTIAEDKKMKEKDEKKKEKQEIELEEQKESKNKSLFILFALQF
jgi:hypothetical protein